MNIRDSVVVVTGGGSGLGAASARMLAARGAKVVVVDVNVERGDAVAREVGGAFERADVGDAEEVTAAVEVAASLGPVRGLVNCAGFQRTARTVDREGRPFDLHAFMDVIRVNLVGTFNCIRLVAAAMAKLPPDSQGERGAIVNTASIAAFEGQIGQVAYAASKGGIVSLTLPVARDLAPLGIRINTVAPGLFDTPIYGSGPAAEEMKERLGSGVVFPPRLGDAGEFASMVGELLTNTYANGEVVRLDGAIRMPPR